MRDSSGNLDFAEGLPEDKGRLQRIDRPAGARPNDNTNKLLLLNFL